MVPGTSALGVPVLLGFEDPAGSTTGHALPTGRPLDTLAGRDGPVEASLIDSGAPVALFDAKAFGYDGNESVAEFAAAVPTLTALRRPAALAMGLAGPDDPVKHGMPVDQDEYVLVVRMVSTHAPHPAIGLTSAIALATAAAIPGTLAHRVARPTADGTLRLGTPAGVITARAVPAPDGVSPTVLLHRAARRIVRAELLVPAPDGRSA